MNLQRMQKFAGPVLALLLGVMLLATIYFTLFDLEWLAFLAGVLFAAVSALTSQSSKSQWLVVRRGRQLERSRRQLTEEGARRAQTAGELVLAEARFRLINDASPVMILFVDRDERCRYHNRAFQHWCGHSNDRIDGASLRDVAGEAVYLDFEMHRTNVLAGRETHYEAEWPLPGGDSEHFSVTMLPYPPGIERTVGYYALIAPVAAAVVQFVHADSAIAATGRGAVVESGDEVYLEAMTEQLGGGDNPREQILQALQQDQFILFAQGIEALAPAAEQGRFFELLLRLQSEEQQMLPPGGFFPVAEHYNLMGEIDRWVVRNLLNQCAARQSGDADWQMPLYCVNISTASLRDSGFPRYVQSELERCNISGGGICFEITELDLIRHHDRVQTLMTLLAPLGCRFTVDGFGGVKVWFEPFRDLRFDFLKIDGTIIQNILTKRSDYAKITAIVHACRKIGVRTIAERVEADDTITMLREIGVDYAQGFGIGRPAPLVLSA